MSGDFDWFGEKDADAIILSYQPPTAVYSTKGGGVCIRQKADPIEEYDPQILLTPQGALAVAWALIEEAHLVGLPQASLSLMAESEHWPPAGMLRRRSEDGLRDAPGTSAPSTPAETPETPETPPGPLLAAMQSPAHTPANDTARPKRGGQAAT